MTVTDKNVKDAITGEIIAGKVVGYKEYDVDGLKVKIDLRESVNSKRVFEFYPNFAENKVFTPEGRPLTLAIEDKCIYGEQGDEGPFIDCTGCKFFKRAAEKTPFGVCMNDKNKKK